MEAQALGRTRDLDLEGLAVMYAPYSRAWLSELRTNGMVHNHGVENGAHVSDISEERARLRSDIPQQQPGKHRRIVEDSVSA